MRSALSTLRRMRGGRAGEMGAAFAPHQGDCNLPRLARVRRGCGPASVASMQLLLKNRPWRGILLVGTRARLQRRHTGLFESGVFVAGCRSTACERSLHG